jgi:hypothetical protein
MLNGISRYAATESLAAFLVLQTTTMLARAAAIIAVILVITATPTYAGVKFIGAGAVSCGTWTHDHQYPDSSGAYLDDQWALGFLSGAADEGPSNIDPLQDLDYNAVVAWITNYCAANPLSKIVAAAEAFIDQHPH